MTEAEARLWGQLRAHRLMGLKFRRQLPIAGYIVDFACAEHKLIVELDGSQHARGDVPDADVVRTRRLNEIGWTVVRFWNGDVMKDLNGVCDHILAVIRERGSDLSGAIPPSLSAAPTSLPQGERVNPQRSQSSILPP